MAKPWQEPNWVDLRARLGELEAAQFETHPDLPYRERTGAALRALVMDDHVGPLMLRAQSDHEFHGERQQGARNLARVVADVEALVKAVAALRATSAGTVYPTRAAADAVSAVERAHTALKATIAQTEIPEVRALRIETADVIDTFATEAGHA